MTKWCFPGSWIVFGIGYLCFTCGVYHSHLVLTTYGCFCFGFKGHSQDIFYDKYLNKHIAWNCLILYLFLYFRDSHRKKYRDTIEYLDSCQFSQNSLSLATCFCPRKRASKEVGWLQRHFFARTCAQVDSSTDSQHKEATGSWMVVTSSGLLVWWLGVKQGPQVVDANGMSPNSKP